MENSPVRVVRRYVYRSTVANGRRGERSDLYLVERLEGSNVVAMIQPLVTTGGRTSTREQALRTLGPWQATKSRHYRRVQVHLADAG
jgi:hypothetical protein